MAMGQEGQQQQQKGNPIVELVRNLGEGFQMLLEISQKAGIPPELIDEGAEIMKQYQTFAQKIISGGGSQEGEQAGAMMADQQSQGKGMPQTMAQR